MHTHKQQENNDERSANIRQLFDSILTGKKIISGAVKNGEKWFTTNCPLPGHRDKKPSFSFNYSGGWTCFTCGKKGDAVHLAKELSLDPRPYYNFRLAKTGVSALPRFDDKPLLKVAHKRKQYKYFEDFDYFKKTLNNDLYNKNNLALYYYKKFGKKGALRVLESYLIGTDSDGATIFWYADINNNICHSKTMQYDKNGHRQGKITTDYYGISTENIKKPLYGEWLARKIDKPIGIVESEKTASAMKIYDETKLYLATGGLSKLDKESLEVYNRQIVFFPDIDAYEKWKIQVDQMNLKGSIVYDISKLWTLNNLSPPNTKADPVDYFFNHVELRWDPDWSQEEYDSIFN